LGHFQLVDEDEGASDGGFARFECNSVTNGAASEKTALERLDALAVADAVVGLRSGSPKSARDVRQLRRVLLDLVRRLDEDEGP
jgi:hypothetical protein